MHLIRTDVTDRKERYVKEVENTFRISDSGQYKDAEIFYAPWVGLYLQKLSEENKNIIWMSFVDNRIIFMLW